jgi:hypothetical protein
MEFMVRVTSRPRFTSQGKNLLYPLDRRLGGPQSWFGHRGKRKNPLPLTGIVINDLYRITGGTI